MLLTAQMQDVAESSVSLGKLRPFKVETVASFSEPVRGNSKVFQHRWKFAFCCILYDTDQVFEPVSTQTLLEDTMVTKRKPSS